MISNWHLISDICAAAPAHRESSHHIAGQLRHIHSPWLLKIRTAWIMVSRWELAGVVEALDHGKDQAWLSPE
jgi:hypothetical protein